MQKQGAIGALFFCMWQNSDRSTVFASAKERWVHHSILTLATGLGRQIPENPR